MIDDEIRGLERELEASPSEEVWTRLDRALERAGNPPRRIWTVDYCYGDYNDRREGSLKPVHFTKAGALAHMKAKAEEMVLYANGPDRFHGKFDHDWRSLSVSFSEIVQ